MSDSGGGPTQVDDPNYRGVTLQSVFVRCRLGRVICLACYCENRITMFCWCKFG